MTERKTQLRNLPGFVDAWSKLHGESGGATCGGDRWVKKEVEKERDKDEAGTNVQ